ncbi:hypothetical protein C3Y89_24290 [Rhizobium sp. UPM1132]|nr:hypothetical protein [Rhizobium ruizarguesonis]
MFYLRLPIKDWLPTVWYPGYLEGMPDLLVGKLPDEFQRTATDRWKIWIVENQNERKALLDALDKPAPMRGNAVDFMSGPDAAVSKVDRSRHYGKMMGGLYPAPGDAGPGWPWITMIRFPSVAIAGPMAPELGRGVYAIDVDLDERAATTRTARMFALAGDAMEIRFPDRKATM